MIVLAGHDPIDAEYPERNSHAGHNAGARALSYKWRGLGADGRDCCCGGPLATAARAAHAERSEPNAPLHSVLVRRSRSSQSFSHSQSASSASSSGPHANDCCRNVQSSDVRLFDRILSESGCDADGSLTRVQSVYASRAHDEYDGNAGAAAAVPVAAVS